MKHRLIAAIVAVVAAFGLAGTSTGAAVAATRSYAATYCTVSPDSKARLTVSRWYNTTSRRWTYHLDMSSRVGVGPDYFQSALYFDGARQSSTNDRYKYSTRAWHKVKGRWRVGATWVSCQVLI